MKRNRIICILLSIFFATILLCGCGKTDNAKVTLGNSNIFSNDDLYNAVNTTKTYFSYTFNKCTLNEIIYDEEFSLSVISQLNLDYLDKDKVLILEIHFDGLIWEKEVTNDFRLVTLTRTGNSNWEVKESGYL